MIKSNVKTPKGKKRVRLEKTPHVISMSAETKAKLSKSTTKAQKERVKNAPRNSNGKIVPGYRYKQIIDSYQEHGMKSEVKDASTYTTTKKPLFLQKPEVGNRIVKLIREGFPYMTVCRYVGVSRNTFLKWLELGSQDVIPIYSKFYRRIAKAEARSEMERLRKLRRHESTDWRAGAWQLERRWPEHWSKRDGHKAMIAMNNTTINVTKKDDLSKAVLRDEHAKELARKLIEGDEFGFSEVQESSEAEAQ